MKKDENKSLFLYTALIFIVALVIILVAFFGQSNFKKSQISHQTAGSITEKSASLSEENLLLREDNLDLSEKLEQEQGEKSQLEAENSSLKDAMNNYDILLSANGYLSAENYKMAAQMLAKINLNSLSSDAKILYDEIFNEINRNM